MEFTRTIKKGMSGEDVRAAKDRLFALGFYSTKVKSIKKDSFGDDTTLALKRFKLNRGLSNYDVIDKATWVALFAGAIEREPSDIVKEMLRFCQTEVDNGSIYVWASGGELGISVDEAWIRKKENRCNGGANFDRAFSKWQRRIESGNRLFKCFDCSGFVSFILRMIGVFNGRRDCDGLYSLSTPLDSPVDGCLLFRWNSNNHEDETHVGLYIDGFQYHAAGRDVGVVGEPYDPDHWHKIAWFKAVPR